MFADLTTDKETVANAANLISAALQDPVVMKSVNELAVHLCSDPEVMDASAKLIIELGLQEEITEATAKLLTNSSHVVMSDPEILDHSKEFVADVVADDAIQRTGGDALWNTITYSVRPGFVSLLASVGVGFVGVGLFALGKGGWLNDGKAEEVIRGVVGGVGKVVSKIPIGGLSGVDGGEWWGKVVKGAGGWWGKVVGGGWGGIGGLIGRGGEGSGG